jgi:hypothetical protein
MRPRLPGEDMSRHRADTDERNAPEADAPAEPEAGPSPFETVFQVVRDEPLLWPVAAVSWLIACTFGGFVLFYALWERSLAGGVALLFAIFFTVWGLDRDIRERRLSGRNAVVLSVWAGSLLGAFGLRALGA